MTERGFTDCVQHSVNQSNSSMLDRFDNSHLGRPNLYDDSPMRKQIIRWEIKFCCYSGESSTNVRPTIS
ncbi:hypothetical protein MKX01_006198 [Papaver californicum]|nr:hypothetical protein MKX01_006198 [Papaver californicum]